MLFSGFPSKLQEQRLDSVAFFGINFGVCPRRAGSKNGFQWGDFVLDLFFYKYDKGKHFSTVPNK